jgi:hypothetical protein
MHRRHSDLSARLRELYGSEDEPANNLASIEHRNELERELADRYRSQRASSQRGILSMTFSAHPIRWVTLGLALTVGVAACTTPTTTEVDMGQELTFHVLQADAQASRDFLDQSKEIADWISARPEVDDLNVNISTTDENGRAYVDLGLVVWGQNLRPDALIRDLKQQYPILGAAEVDTRDLVGEVRESFAKKVARQTLKLEVSGDSADEIRAGIMAQLVAAGMDEGAEVNVQQADGLTTIGVTISGEGQETEDVIEILGDELPEGIEVPVGGDLAAEGDGPVIVEEKEIRKK